MSEFTDGGGADNTVDLSPESVDSQLNEMRNAERAERDTPEPKQEPEQRQEEGQQAERQPKTVPLEALHEARGQFKAERAAREQAERTFAERMAVLEQRLQSLAAPPQAPPSVQDDPVAYFEHRLNQTGQQAQAAIQQAQLLQQQNQQHAQMQALAQQVARDQADFSAKTPDYSDALAHLRANREQELVAYGADPAAASQAVGQELFQMALQARAQGRNPAEIAYQLAKVRGYAPQAAANPAQKLEAERRGVAAARSLGNGGQASGKLTAEALATMSDSDFKKLSESDWRKAMGG